MERLIPILVAYLLLPVVAMAAPTPDIEPEAPKQETIVVKETEPEAESQPVELTLAEKIAQNVNGCEPDRIRADNAECLPPESVERVASLDSTPVSGNKYDWLKASGIPESEWMYVDFIVQHESSWNPNAVNPNGGACGLGQQLPCGKWSGAWNDPVAALQNMNTYVGRYGGWAGAYNFWTVGSCNTQYGCGWY